MGQGDPNGLGQDGSLVSSAGPIPASSQCKTSSFIVIDLLLSIDPTLGFLLSAREASTLEKSQSLTAKDRKTPGLLDPWRQDPPHHHMFLFGACLLLLCVLCSSLSPILHFPPSGLYLTLPVMALSGVSGVNKSLNLETEAFKKRSVEPGTSASSDT